MFSLLITIIAIALVAALALATLYYGGPIFNEGAERANVAKIDAQGQQIMGAMELFRAETGKYPNTLDDLVSTEYLKSIPVAQAEQVQVVVSAFAATSTWSLSSPGQPVIVMKPVSVAICQAYNKAQFGIAGILSAPHTSQLKQCFGSDLNNLMIVQAKAGNDLVYVSTDPSAVVQIGQVVGSPLPSPTSTDTSVDGWLLPPGATASPPGTPTASVSTTLLAFPDTSVDSTSSAQSVTVTNTGTVPLTFSATGVTVGSPFNLESDACSGQSIQPQATCLVSVSFSPVSAGVFAGSSYAISFQATNATLNSVSLKGTGLPVVVSTATPFTLTINGVNAGYIVKWAQGVNPVRPELVALGFPLEFYGPYQSLPGAELTLDETTVVQDIPTPFASLPLWWGSGTAPSPLPSIQVTITNTGASPLTLFGAIGQTEAGNDATITCSGTLAAGASCSIPLSAEYYCEPGICDYLLHSIGFFDTGGLPTDEYGRVGVPASGDYQGDLNNYNPNSAGAAGIVVQDVSGNSWFATPKIRAVFNPSP